MGKVSSSSKGSKGGKGKSKSKKGPKGKKARAKAKLQRQWGEEANTNDVTGKDPLQLQPRGQHVKAAAKAAKKAARQSNSNSNHNHNSNSRRLAQEQHEQQAEADAAYEYDDETLLDKKKKKRSPNDSDDDGSSGSFSCSDSDDDDDGNDNDDDNEEASDKEKEACTTISKFLATIQKKTKTQRKRQKVGVGQRDDDDNDDDDDDEDVEEQEHDAGTSSRRNRTITTTFISSTAGNQGNQDDEPTNMDNDDDIISSSSIIDNENNNNNNNNKNSVIDIFFERFSHPPLPEKEADLAKEMKRIQQHQTVKIPISFSTSSSKNSNDQYDKVDGGASATLEMQLSKVWVEKQKHATAAHVDSSSRNSSCSSNYKGKNQHDDDELKLNWKDLATRALTGNREILKQNWTKIQHQQHQQQKQKQQQQGGKKTNTIRDDDDAKSCRLPFSVLYPLLATYADVLYPAVPLDDISSSHKESSSSSNMTQRALCLHILNHVMTTRMRIFKHNRKLKQLEAMTAAAAAAAAAEKAATENEDHDDDDDDDDNKDTTPQPQQPDDDSSSSWSRDQGFTRPTVLVLLPTGGTCYTFVKTMLSLLSGSTTTSITSNSSLGTVDNLERFETEYGPQDENDKDDDDVVQVADMTPEQKLRRKKVLQQKGPEWLELFADEVNDNDDFKMGIAIHPKGTTATRMNKSSSNNGDDNDQQQHQEGSCSVKLYADFYRSDIIVASPLGLKMSLAAADNAANRTSDDDDNDNDDHHHDHDDSGKNRQSRNRRADFLSSIEICLLARADVMYMQNWDHVQDVLDRVNQPLENSFNVDFARVRPYHLAGQAQYWRQLILCSAWSDPLLSHTFTRHAHSIAGLARIRKRVSTARADIAQVLVVPEIKQVFQRVATTSVLTQSHDRIEYFCQHLLPRMIRQEQRHTLIFVPNYLEFVSLRNRLLKQQEMTSGTTASTYCDFVAVTEYSRTSETSRGRARFIQGRKAILLYTGRAHFFHRHVIKGARHLIFFGLPEYANFYSHHVNLLNDAESVANMKHDKKKKGSNNGKGGDHDGDYGITLSCTVLFTKYESHALERIVGTSNCKRMVGGEKSTFFFIS